MMKKLLYFIGIPLVLLLLFAQGCRSLKRTIYTSMDCDQFNIDHIELRAGINIPKIKTLDCEIDSNQRKSSYLVLLEGTEKAAYAQNYFTYDNLHFKASGSNYETSWTATYDTTSNQLEFHLKYHHHE